MGHWLMTPSEPIGSVEPPPPPDYADPDSWAARPGMDSPAQDVPPGVPAPDPETVAKIDVFYVHPTTYFWRWAWNAEPHGWLSDAIINVTLRDQASAFNSSGRIYAPYYRQLTLSGFDMPKTMEKGLAIAYSDIKRAFQYFLEHDNESRPIFLVGHSQGSRLIKRLLRDFFSDPPLRDRLVAAYAVGTEIRREGNLAVPGDTPICQTPNQTGCLVSWRTYSVPAPPEKVKPGEAFVCINPLTWKDNEKSAPPSANLGTVYLPIAGLSRPEPGLVGARCEGARLVINEPDSWRLNLWAIDHDYHAEDFNLFYMNIRENAERRARTALSP